MNQTLLLATHNIGKLREFQQIFAALPLQVISLADAGITWEVEEMGQTFEENARLKAQAYRHATQLLTLADDSGLEVDALGGAPGVHSARYGGPNLASQQRVVLLLEQLKEVPAGKRQARFRCVIALAQPHGPIQTTEGVCEGEIAFAPRGAGGFGYDPVFYLPEYGLTMAELPPEVKNRISHRGRAADAAKQIVQAIIANGMRNTEHNR